MTKRVQRFVVGGGFTVYFTIRTLLGMLRTADDAHDVDFGEDD